MNSGLYRVILAALLAICPCAIRAGVFETIPRPSGAVFDPSGILDAAERKEISAPLERIFKDEGVEVIAVALEDPDGLDSEEAAGQMAAAWCDAPLHAVVLHIRGRDGGPWIVAGGELLRSLDPGEVRDELALAHRDASREPDDAAKLRTAATATADLLRYWQGREAARLALMDHMRAAIRLELETRARKQQILMLTATAAAIPLIVGVMTAIRLLGKPRLSSDKP